MVNKIKLLLIINVCAQNIMAVGDVAEAEIIRRSQPVKHYVVEKPAKTNPYLERKVVYHQQPEVQPKPAPAKRYIILPPGLTTSTISQIVPKAVVPPLRLEPTPVRKVKQVSDLGRPKGISLKEWQAAIANQPVPQRKQITILEQLTQGK